LPSIIREEGPTYLMSLAMSNQFIPIERDKPVVIPVQEWLAEDHLARFIVEIVESLDVTPLEAAYGGGGSAPYPAKCWPSAIRVVAPGRRAWRLEVGSKAEMILLPVLIVATVGLYPLSHLGFRDSLQVLLANFDIARDDFIHQAGTHWYAVDLTATDSLTLQRIRCRCPVVGVWQRGLIVLYEGQLRAVGQSPVSHDLYPVTARLLEGPPLTVVAHKVDMRGRTLRWLLSRLDQSRTYFLLGELDIKSDKVRPVADIALYKPAVYRGNVLTLHYARAGELTPWLNLVAAQGEIHVQFWLKPGDPAVAFTPGEERPVERIPEQLKPFL